MGKAQSDVAHMHGPFPAIAQQATFFLMKRGRRALYNSTRYQRETSCGLSCACETWQRCTGLVACTLKKEPV